MDYSGMYQIQPKDLSRASNLLGRAFNNYPLFEHVLPNPASRREKLKHFCHFLLRLGMSKGVVVAPSDALEGISIWLPSNRSPKSASDVLRAAFRLFLHVDKRALVRFIQIGAVKGKNRAAILSRPYCICDMIGVDPIYQGRGVGRHMIEEQLKYLEKKPMPCYLETSEAKT